MGLCIFQYPTKKLGVLASHFPIFGKLVFFFGALRGAHGVIHGSHSTQVTVFMQIRISLHLPATGLLLKQCSMIEWSRQGIGATHGASDGQ
jgi:hypothetical protein